MTEEKRTQNTADAVMADAERQTREREEEDAKRAIQEQQKLLQMARREVEEAQRRLNVLLDRPPIEEPPAWSDMVHAREFVPDRPAPSRGKNSYATPVNHVLTPCRRKGRIRQRMGIFLWLQ